MARGIIERINIIEKRVNNIYRKVFSAGGVSLIENKIDKFTGDTYTANSISVVTQAEYDALTPNANTIYFIT